MGKLSPMARPMTIRPMITPRKDVADDMSKNPTDTVERQITRITVRSRRASILRYCDATMAAPAVMVASAIPVWPGLVTPISRRKKGNCTGIM